MIVLQRMMRGLRRHARRLSWLAVFSALVAHLLITWTLLALVGESKLVGLDAFPYYYMTTATTIGYGDLSPATVAGRYVVALWLMPGAVALFATVLAKTSQNLGIAWRRSQMGLQTFDDASGHTVLVGWRGEESLRLVHLLLSDTVTDDEGIILVAAEVTENPLPEHLRFVRTRAYTDYAIYARAAVQAAARVIIAPPSDDQTLAAVFAVMAEAPTAHVVAHFEHASTSGLVQRHYPSVECTRPMHVEVIARAAQDAGSSAVTAELLSLDGGPTQFSLVAPACDSGYAFERLSDMLRHAHDAMLVGYRGPQHGAPCINPPRDAVVPAGAQLYYVAQVRALPHDHQWEAARA